jgi:hypothetical protein
MGTTSCFGSFESVVGSPVVMGCPPSSFNSKPENFTIIPSLKFSLISLGEAMTETSGAGLADSSLA